MSKWTEYVTKYYKDEKAKNGGYKFKDALKDAAKTYKKHGKAEAVNVKGKDKGKKRRTMKNRTRKQKK